jgi:tellurite resistance protein TerC
VSPRALLWVGFNLAILALLLLDLGLFRREARPISPKEGALWTCFYVGLSGLFGMALWKFYCHQRALEFFTAYVVEYALSVDNLFVFLLVLAHFQVRPEVRHRLLFWGILGAFAMRAGLILMGTALVASFHWLLYAFGAFLIFTAVRLVLPHSKPANFEQGWLVRTTRRVLPVADSYDGPRFFVRQGQRLWVTPLFLVLLVVEITDLLFAVDSIPAVLGISQDAFIVYSSNVCALLGLRSLLFVVASLLDKVRYLKFGLSGVLAFVGTKMLLSGVWHIPVGMSLAVIGVLLAASVLVSVVWGMKHKPAVPS